MKTPPLGILVVVFLIALLLAFENARAVCGLWDTPDEEVDTAVPVGSRHIYPKF